jgi:hypothetical protein
MKTYWTILKTNSLKVQTRDRSRVAYTSATSSCHKIANQGSRRVDDGRNDHLPTPVVRLTFSCRLKPETKVFALLTADAQGPSPETALAGSTTGETHWLYPVGVSRDSLSLRV